MKLAQRDMLREIHNAGGELVIARRPRARNDHAKALQKAGFFELMDADASNRSYKLTDAGRAELRRQIGTMLDGAWSVRTAAWRV